MGLARGSRSVDFCEHVWKQNPYRERIDFLLLGETCEALNKAPLRMGDPVHRAHTFTAISASNCARDLPSSTAPMASRRCAARSIECPPVADSD
jgi:hypothetical protein